MSIKYRSYNREFMKGMAETTIFTLFSHISEIACSFLCTLT